MSSAEIPQEPKVRSTYYAVIPDASGARFLVQQGDDGWALPCFAGDTGVPNDMPRLAQFNLALREQLGLDVTALRSLFSRADHQARQHFSILLMENHDPQWTLKDGMSWVGRDGLTAVRADFGVVMPEQGAVLEAWLVEVESSVVPPRRAPWAIVGWYDSAVSWIESQLGELGIKMTGPIEQVRNWSISSILRVPTKNGYVYFKAVPTIFAREPRLAKALAERFPDYICKPLAIAEYADQGWMLQLDFGAKLADNITIESTEIAVRALARIQAASVPDIDRLLTDGCADRRLETIPPEFEALLADESTLKDLNAEERGKLLAFAPNLDAICTRLSGYAVPQTLAHGDFHANNIAFNDGNPVIFDWTDGCVAHPFIDLPVLLEFDTPEDAPDARLRLRDAYLQEWTAFEPMDRLLEAFGLGEAVAAAHQAISYRHIVASVEDAQRWEMDEGTTEFLRVLLKHIEQGVSRQ